MVGEVPRYITKFKKLKEIPKIPAHIKSAGTSKDRIFLWCDDVVSFGTKKNAATYVNKGDIDEAILSIINEYLHIIFSFLHDTLPLHADESSAEFILKSIANPSNEPLPETHCHEIYEEIMFVLSVIFRSVRDGSVECSTAYNEVRDFVADYWKARETQEYDWIDNKYIIDPPHVDIRHLRRILARHAPRWYNTCESLLRLGFKDPKTSYIKRVLSCLHYDPFAILCFAEDRKCRFTGSQYVNGFDTSGLGAIVKTPNKNGEPVQEADIPVSEDGDGSLSGYGEEDALAEGHGAGNEPGGEEGGGSAAEGEDESLPEAEEGDGSGGEEKDDSTEIAGDGGPAAEGEDKSLPEAEEGDGSGGEEKDDPTGIAGDGGPAAGAEAHVTQGSKAKPKHKKPKSVEKKPTGGKQSIEANESTDWIHDADAHFDIDDFLNDLDD